jgi:hypothetical protein
VPEQPQVTRREPQPYVSVPFTVTMATFPQAADAGFPEILGWLGARGITPSGPPFIRYGVIDMDGELEIEIGAPVAAGRFEFYPTDPRQEPDPARWQVEITYLITGGA